MRAGNTGAELTLLDGIALEMSHLTKIFPEDSNETITFTAPAGADTFSAWAEIVDNNAVTLSSKFAANGGHITGILTESASVTDKIYIFEISYGASKIIIATGRLLSGTVLLTAKQQQRMSSVPVPAGETVYYRIKCETGAASVTVSLRYHMDW